MTNRQIEIREDPGGNGKLTLEGYASRTETPYEVLGFTETIRRGAFKRSLKEGPDTSLLVNHEGMPIARTTAGTLALAEDENGLRVRAELEPEDPDVQAIAWKMRSGALTEMSMGFRATKQQWNEDRTRRVIQEVALHRSDVSIVSAAASPTSTATLRSMEATLEQRKRMADRIGDRLCGPVGFTFQPEGASHEYVTAPAATASRGRSQAMFARSHLELAKAKRAKLGSRAAPKMPAHSHVARRYTVPEVQALGKEGKAHKRADGKYNFPIVDRRDLLDAILAVGRTDPGERFSVKRWIVYRAKLLGMKSEVPKDWVVEVGEAVKA
jgi:HK97 family phage prohead protease